jgi:hypothetical protein
MNCKINFVTALIGLLVFFMGEAPAAGATRTWVSGVGDDVNPCSRTAPCKTFAGAISKTAAGGEISVLDPGGFGAVTITKSISIVAEGSEGSILASGTNGININAAPTDIINLHGLFIEGNVTGTNGLNILSAKSVHIRKCLIRNFRSANGTGILIAPTSATIAVFVSDCTISDNTRGVANVPAGGTATVVLDRVIVQNNTNAGVLATGASASNTLTNSTVSGNNVGLKVTGGTIVSLGNNTVLNNVTNGAPTSTAPLE